MADTNVTISASSVLANNTYGKAQYNTRLRAGSTITAGILVYSDGTSNWAPVNVAAGSGGTTTKAGSGIFGFAANGASNGQYLIVQVGGGISLNTGGSSGLSVGEWYRLSQNGTGALASMSGYPVQTGNWTTIVGFCPLADTIQMFEYYNGLAHA